MQGKILVVGGAGFIGSHVNLELNHAGFETVVYDNLSTGKKEAVLSGIFIEGDIVDEKKLSDLFQKYKIDAVMHFAAHIDVEESVLNPAKYYENNVVKTLTLLNVMRKHGVDTFIFSSTAAIFGMPKTGRIKEDHEKRPINPYGNSKLMVETILKDFQKAYGLKYASLRYFNAAGGDPQKKLKNLKVQETNLIPVILRNIREQKNEMTIFGTDYPTKDGTCIRDYIHIIDLADAHIKALKALQSGASSLEFNLGNGEGFSVREVVNTAEKIVGEKIQVTEGKRRVGDPPVLIADGTLAAKKLNWKPKYQLSEMVEHAWAALK